MDKQQFEQLLVDVCDRLSSEAKRTTDYHKPSAFEKRVRTVMSEALVGSGHEAAPNIDQGFPDIVVDKFGAEVKATESDSWRCIANSVSEGQRARDVEHIYIVYGKFGGTPHVEWASYGDSIMHVRTSHVPRFEIEIGTEKPLFGQLGTTYETFRELPMHEKMPLIREYARGRLKPGERLWWLEDTETDDQPHTLSLEVRSVLKLPPDEERMIRAESALLVPQIVSKPRTKAKNQAYVDVAMYLMTYRGILAHQTRDLFSAGSVAGKERGGNYLLRALVNIQSEIRSAAQHLEDKLFIEYWGSCPEPSDRLTEWLRMADAFAHGWKPSEFLFLEEQGKA